MVTACSYDPKLKMCPVMGIILVDQWNPKLDASQPNQDKRLLIKRRTVNRHGRMLSNGSFPLISDNAEAFFIIER